jgi:hypothetical protein
VAGKIKGVTYEVKGGANLRRTLKKVEGGLDDLKAVHGEVAQIVADRAQTTVPRVTGTLAGTIRPGATKTMAVVRAGFARVPYAGVQEFGWPARNIPPNPYLRPAAHDTESTWLKTYNDEIDELLSKVKGI